MATIPLSILDLAPVGSGYGAAEALHNSTDLARRAERLGFGRIWVAEHHNMPGIASTAPEVLIAHLASATDEIRIGSGGVMLPNHSPLAVAERFGMLEALHPGRIDLALGRAPGTDHVTAYALGARGAQQFPQEVSELAALLRGEGGRISAVSSPDGAPSVWVLGSSGDGAQIAAALGAGYAHAHHIGPHNTVPALELYRERFAPSALGESPRTIVAAHAIAAESDEEAQWQARPHQVTMARLRAGMPSKLPTPEEAAATEIPERHRAAANARAIESAIGTADEVHAKLAALAARSGADELMLTTIVHGHDARVRSYELIAARFGLLGGPPASGQPATATP